MNYMVNFQPLQLAFSGQFSTGVNRTYHAFDHAKYAHRYLAEFSYRFNRRFDLAGMVPRLLHAAVVTNPMTHDKLRLSERSN